MGLEWNEVKREYVWTGSVRGLVNAVGSGDARLGFVVDSKSGAKIAMNIDGGDFEETDEPFYIESSDGDNMYDAYNRKEAVMILSNIRKGKKYPDIPDEPKPRKKKSKKKTAKRAKKGKATRAVSSSRR